MPKTNTDVMIRRDGVAGRITLNRPNALNALTPEMCQDILARLRMWREDPEVHLVILDAAGERAFCAGGDVAEVYRRGIAGDASFAQEFWRVEYEMNLALADFPKPIVSFMQGYTLGGGVGLGCHIGKRVVCETSQIGMPESLIGLVTDVGGTLLLARAPGRIGEYLMLTAQRMDAAAAIAAGFADRFVPHAHWPALIERLCDTGSLCAVDSFAIPASSAPAPSDPALFDHLDEINSLFSHDTLSDIFAALSASSSVFAAEARAQMAKNDPLAMAASRCLIEEARRHDSLKEALAGEFRFTYRVVHDGHILEGVRARLIDKDNAPNWQQGLDGAENAAEPLLRPLGDQEMWTS